MSKRHRPGPRNLLTDVAGLRVGHFSDSALKSGTSVILCDRPSVAAVQVLGGAPGTRETDLLEPHNNVETINALVLSGGSAFGLDAASGVQAALRAKGVGYQVAGATIPIVPAAILFDLANGGNKDWGLYPPYREFGFEAVGSASEEFALGTIGAGTGLPDSRSERRAWLCLQRPAKRSHSFCARLRQCDGLGDAGS